MEKEQMVKSVVTGASGFIGKRLCSALRERNIKIRAAIRPSSVYALSDFPEIEISFVNDIGDKTDWSEALDGADIVFHLAGRAHIMKDRSSNPLEDYRKINVKGTQKLIQDAAKFRVKRIIYLSTVKVNGELTAEKPFNENDEPNPQDAYAISKMEAEESVRYMCERYGIEHVIIRVPLVYGPGVKGNLLRLLELIHKGVPLPLLGINNRRSLISLENLVDALILSALSDESRDQLFLLSDGYDISTTKLAELISFSMRSKKRFFRIPDFVTLMGPRFFPFLKHYIDRLTGSLVVDSSKFRTLLGWKPPQTIEEGIDNMVNHFLRKKNDGN